MSRVDGPSTENRRWTADQRRGIETRGSVLVSAAAGSGKTSVLAERCAHLVCDGPDRCAIDELLVVTFTEAAAAEMKGRIHAALAGRAAENPQDMHIAQQLALADSAQVGTLHAFCARVLRQHFHQLGIDPGFVILDADESAMIKLDVAREMLGEWFDREDRSSAFAALVDAYGDGDDERIVQFVLRLHEMLASLVDPADWTQRAVRRLEEAARRPLHQSELGQLYLRYLERDLAALAELCAQQADALSASKPFAAYADYIRQMESAVAHWIGVLKSDGPDALVEESAIDFPAIPRLSTALPGRDAAKKRVEAVVEEVKKGDWRQGIRFTQRQWADGIAQTLPHARLLLELVEEFGQRYAAAKNDAGGLDFSDLERLTLTALADASSRPGKLVPSAAAQSYQRQFRHVLVDEYQDINELQDAILSLVSRDLQESRQRPSRLEPNLFCVGDVKQSIYRFRLADPSLFGRRRERYAESSGNGVVIDLQENFRSRSALLEAINGVFRRLMSAEAAELEYDRTHELRAGAVFPDPAGEECCFAGAPIELHLLPQQSSAAAGESTEVGEEETAETNSLNRSQREAGLIADRILQLLGRRGMPPMRVVDRAGGGSSTRPIRFGDIVILLRSMQYKADGMVDALRNAGIPVHSETTTGYFEATEINDVLSLLAVLDNAAQDIPLAALLRSPLAMLDAPEDALVTLRLAYPDQPFHAAVAAYEREAIGPLAEQLRQLWEQLARWRAMIRRRPLAEVLWSIYQQSGFLAFCAGLPGGEQRQANLIELHERARQFGSFRRQGLPRFLQFLQKLKTDSDLGQAAVASPAEDVVRVMSIHRSKGLEFPVVIVGDMGKAINFRDACGPVLADRCEGIGLSVVDLERRVRYPSLASAVLSRRLREQTIAEELRVLYVAMTRAKEHLVLVGTCRADQPAKWTDAWTNHAGALPAATVLGASTMLDWIGPVAAAAGDATIHITMHERGDVEAAMAARQPTATNEHLAALAAMRPMEPAPPVSPAAQQAIDRLCQRYPFEPLTRCAATTSVTARAKPQLAPLLGDESTLIGATASAVDPALPLADQLLPNPKFFGGARSLTAADRGTATHTVLQHLKFPEATDSAAILRQVQGMVHGRRLTEAMAAAVDVEAIGWLLRQEVGQLLVERFGVLLREVPVTFTVPPSEPAAAAVASADPRDRVMVRGRLDVLVPVGNELVIVDYKTDRVEGDGISRRAEEYREQLAMYREAIEKISERRVRRAVLVFLYPRECRDA